MLLTVGRVLRPHSVRGEVVVDVRTDEPEQRYVPGARLLTDATAPPSSEPGGWRVPHVLTIEAVRPHQGRLIVTFREVPDRDRAEALRGALLQVDSATVAPPADPDEFHDYQLEGLAAVTPAGEALGEVTRIDHAPASDLLVVRRPDGRSVLVPFVTAFVPEVDLDGGLIVVDPPAGLLDL